MGGQAWGGWAREAGKGVGDGGSRELGGDVWLGGWTWARKRGGASLGHQDTRDVGAER